MGFDILFDANLKAWLIEVNIAPSFAADSLLDKKLKTCLIEDTLEIMHQGSTQKKLEKDEHCKNGWVCVFPSETRSMKSSEYQKFMKHAKSTVPKYLL